MTEAANEKRAIAGNSDLMQKYFIREMQFYNPFHKDYTTLSLNLSASVLQEPNRHNKPPWIFAIFEFFYYETLPHSDNGQI